MFFYLSHTELKILYFSREKNGKETKQGFRKFWIILHMLHSHDIFYKLQLLQSLEYIAYIVQEKL